MRRKQSRYDARRVMATLFRLSERPPSAFVAAAWLLLSALMAISRHTAGIFAAMTI